MGSRNVPPESVYVSTAGAGNDNDEQGAGSEVGEVCDGSVAESKEHEGPQFVTLTFTPIRGVQPEGVRGDVAGVSNDGRELDEIPGCSDTGPEGKNVKLNIETLQHGSPIYLLWELRNEIIAGRKKRMNGVVLELAPLAKRNLVKQLCDEMSLKSENLDILTLTEVFGMEVRQVDTQPQQNAYVVIEGYMWAIVDTARGAATKVTVEMISLDGLHSMH